MFKNWHRGICVFPKVLQLVNSSYLLGEWYPFSLPFSEGRNPSHQIVEQLKSLSPLFTVALVLTRPTTNEIKAPATVITDRYFRIESIIS